MLIGVPAETFPGERRVALVPGLVGALLKLKVEVAVQRGAGEAAGFPDAAYAEQGARLVPSRDELFQQADLLLQVRALGANPHQDDLPRLRQGQVLAAFLEPLAAPLPLQHAASRGITAFALELVPRITRAQSLDALSSQATLAGYKAVLLAANALPRIFPMLMTAAGTVTPAKVLVLGAGVAGLQAIATAKRLGAVVSGYDIRPAVKEQVESLGARFVQLPLETAAAETKGGYAREMDAEFQRKQRELLASVVAESDVVITTAMVPGRRAPVLITEAMVRGMRPGSVLVDLAAERGGNCALTKPGETVVVEGVSILGPTDLPAQVPFHASQLYAKNLLNLLQLLIKDGQVVLNLEDQVVKDTMVTHNGEVTHPQVKEALAALAANASKQAGA